MVLVIIEPNPTELCGNAYPTDEYTRMNTNTGIEYELGVALALIQGGEISGTHTEDTIYVIKSHAKRTVIYSIAEKLCSQQLFQYVQYAMGIQSITDIQLISQDDSTPGDILCHTLDRYPGELALSIKYNTHVSRNPTGRLFLSRSSICQAEHLLRQKIIPAYINEMTHEYGAPSHWFRKRRQSEVVNSYIHTIVAQVVQDWNTLLPYWKAYIMRRCLQYEATTPYLILFLNKNVSHFQIQDAAPSESWLMDVSRLYASSSSHSKQDVLFIHEIGGTVAKMQVKFNNGILEQSKSQRDKERIQLDEGVYAKPGNAISSWNFELREVQPRTSTQWELF